MTASPPTGRIIFPEIQDIVELYYPLARDLLNFPQYRMPAFAWHNKQGLEGAIGAAKNGYYDSIEECAANFCYYCIKNHPFRDGNKRMGVIILITFLLLNGFEYRRRPELSTEAIISLAEHVADSHPENRAKVIHFTKDWIDRYFIYRPRRLPFMQLWGRLRLRR